MLFSPLTMTVVSLGATEVPDCKRKMETMVSWEVSRWLKVMESSSQGILAIVWNCEDTGHHHSSTYT